jgi:aerobic-type carbon monoxide dehydrogenase small subunit (CoxS/CutS family)
MTTITINTKEVTLKSDPATPLLWVLRDELGLTGSKFGCGIALCGACTVHLDGQAVRSCVTPLAAATGKSVTTIEGLSAQGLSKVQQAWIKHQVPQCGYCQSGFLMAASALFAASPKPTEAQIEAALTNICRCGTYDAMRAALKEVIA